MLSNILPKGSISLAAMDLSKFVNGWTITFMAKQAGDNLSGEINFSVIQPDQILDAVPIAHSPIHV